MSSPSTLPFHRYNPLVCTVHSANLHAPCAAAVKKEEEEEKLLLTANSKNLDEDWHTFKVMVSSVK
jgi:hypothetical protein